MKHGDGLLNDSAVENTAYPFRGLHSQLKETVTHGPRMRHAKVRTMRHHPLRAMDVSGPNPSRQRHDFLLHLFAIVLDRPVPSVSNVSYLVPTNNSNVKLFRVWFPSAFSPKGFSKARRGAKCHNRVNRPTCASRGTSGHVASRRPGAVLGWFSCILEARWLCVHVPGRLLPSEKRTIHSYLYTHLFSGEKYIATYYLLVYSYGDDRHKEE